MPVATAPSRRYPARMATSDSPFPQQVVIEPTAACNQQCIFCGRTYMERPKKTMTQEIFRRIADEIASESPDTELWPTFMGEATLLGQKLYDWIAYARKVGCRKITLNTNGTKLNEKTIPALLDCGIDRLIVSCDAHTAETHARVRPGRHTEGLPGIYRGVHHILELMNQKKTKTPIVEMQFSVFEENEHEFEAFRTYWLAQGVIVKIRPKVFWSGEVEGGEKRAHEKDRVPCLWSLDTAAIQWNGNVVMCAIDCDGKYVAGNIQMQSLKQIWTGPLRWMRELQLAKRFKELPSVCRECPDWKVKRAQVFFPNDALQAEYEAYVRRGRTFTPEHFWNSPAVSNSPA